MVLWFIGTAVATVWFVFGDPRFDYRPLIVGSIVPSLIDVWSGGMWVMHTLSMSVVILVAAMVLTIGRRRLRRSLLGVALGILLHLVFTGAWADTGVFWWPFSGARLGVTPLPEISRGWLNVPLEVIGAALVGWIVVRAGLAAPDARREFLRSGYLALPRRG
jgi:hypothetical protein